MKKRQRRTYVAIGMCAGAVIAIIALIVVLSQNIEYFRTVSEAVAHRQVGTQLRMAGAWSGRITGQASRAGDGVTTTTVQLDGEHARLQLSVMVDASGVLHQADVGIGQEPALTQAVPFPSDAPLATRPPSEVTPAAVRTLAGGTS